ncbi:AAA family ATPase [Clostridium sp. LP20]|uniref:AAA family ATPase n=1 Tax=Clostridium sp. LP20 TaxID=3418665 RepID=UPI003EE5D15B
MKIKYIAWKKVICSEVKRLIYGIQGPGISNKGDQAIQNFNIINENPGLWRGFTNGQIIPRKKEIERQNRQNGTSLKTTFDIPLANSVNPLRLWEDKNDARKNPVKINHEIWDRNQNHEKAIIEIWYLGYMRILDKLLSKYIEINGEEYEATALKEFISERLESESLTRENLLKWIYDTQDGFNSLTIDTTFLADSNIKNIKTLVESNFYLVVKCVDDDGNESNYALMANVHAHNLHPLIKSYLTSNEKGGEYVDIDIQMNLPDIGNKQVSESLAKNNNIILYGPPGTGKTRLLMDIVNTFKMNTIFDDFNTQEPFLSMGNSNKSAMKWCTFHANYAYENFVVGLEPVVKNRRLGYTNHIGPFLELADKSEQGYKTLLVIDEINRAKTDDVFGNTIALLDKKVKAKESIMLPYDVEMENGRVIRSVSVGEDFYIIGTMNSLDKSTSPLSTEFKRRFKVIEILPDVEVLREYLSSNIYIDKEFCDFCCQLMQYLNRFIQNWCGKEYMFGQGYFWELTRASSNIEEVFKDIITNKLIPHIKEVVPSEAYADLFGNKNLEIVYSANEYGYIIKDLTSLNSTAIINAMANACKHHYRMEEIEEENEVTTFEEYEKKKVAGILGRLHNYKNVILTGCSGVGKSTITKIIANDPSFSETSKMHWHESTSYDEVIEGIATDIVGDEINYSIKDGMVKALAKKNIDKNSSRLMILENINRSNAAENFGELITLLEQDKRDAVKIQGYEEDIIIPSDMCFLCTMTPSIYSNNRLDSALKRRFLIIELTPDYKMLELWLEVGNMSIDLNEVDDIISLSIPQRNLLAIDILKSVNERIQENVDENCQIGHGALWGLKQHNSFREFINIIENELLVQVEDLCIDTEVAEKILGINSPLIQRFYHGIEVRSLSSLTEEEIELAIRELIKVG